jgi:hypothetical protein
MLEIVLGNSELIYVLKKGDLKVTYSISFKSYFELSKIYDVDGRIKELLENEMNKYECRNLYV